MSKTITARLIDCMTISELAQSINKPVYFVGPGDLQFACWVTEWVEFSSIEPMSELEKTLTSI